MISKLIRQHYWIPLVSAAFVAVAGIYCLLAPLQYEVSGTVVVHRQRVENPNTSGEDEKNRWIWVRDGMGLKESLLSDKNWLGSLQENPLLKARFETFLKKNAKSIETSRKLGATEEDIQVSFSQNLIRQVNVDFTGGDSYSYVVRVRDLDPLFAKALVTALIDRAKVKIVQESQQAYQSSLQAIAESLKSTKNRESLSYLKSTEKQLKVASLLFDSTALTRVEVVRTPHIPLKAVWPRPELLLLVALFLGATIGLGVELGRSYLNAARVTV